MKYVQRNAAGSIVGVYANPQPGFAEETISDDDPELALFLGRLASGVEEISDRQFFQQLAAEGLISQAEALAAVKTGDIPAAMQTLIDGLPEGERFAAQMLIAGATVFRRSHPLTYALGVGFGMAPAEVDRLWAAAAAL
ncbi:hypothetical protein RA307_31675 [Xanthobacteraceae bacterium Astr-EGSB]|uniref:hypothetical protein n=1 Tax=Astrobacterium formosum TaxID=3069710 RepID=UPI0027B06D2D|nr:hypothetical protein [Xanthobacteraceae bacterium Astr-EGSB]